MLSYLLIALVCGAAYRASRRHRCASVDAQSPNPAAEEFVQAVARYDTSDWRMVVATDRAMTQADWDQTLESLSSNIAGLEQTGADR